MKARTASAPDAQSLASHRSDEKFDGEAKQGWPPFAEDLFGTGQSGPAKRMVSNNDEIEREEHEEVPGP